MSSPCNLAHFREFRNWNPDYIANKLDISLESYLDLERGKTKIGEVLAQKLSDIYQAPVEIFVADDTQHYLQADLIYYNCVFTSGSGPCSGYTNHQYNDRGIDEILYSKKEEIKSLRQQIEEVQRQNMRLLELLVEKIKGS